MQDLQPTTAYTGAAATLKSLDRFEILGELGAGAFGRVYRAFDPKLGREVALKVPTDAALASESDRLRFLSEARAAATLNHPNVCQIYEVGECEGRPYLVMALIPGQSLAAVIKFRASPLPQKQAALLVRKLALALAAAHEKGVVHRDLKPSNVMFDRERKDVVVMDFGLARCPQFADARVTQTGMVMGTPAYMSPEQARGDSKESGPSGDIFSLGVILYELLTGKRPFVGTTTEIIGQLLHVEAEAPSKHRPDVDPRLEQICLNALEKRPEDRFASMKDFAAALSDYLKSGSTLQPTATLAANTANSGEATGTNSLTSFVAAMSAELEEKVERAARSAVENAKPRHVPWWTYLAGSAVVGLVVLLGVLLLAQRGSATIIVQLPLPPGVDLSDTSLEFILDQQPITAEQLGQPIKLKEGEHELLINRDGQTLQRMKFNVVFTRGKVAVDILEVAGSPPTPPLLVAPFTPAQAVASQQAWAKYLGVEVETKNSLEIPLRLIPPGIYRRGTSEEDLALLLQLEPKIKPALRTTEMPQHTVHITKPFYLGKFEVTVAQYRSFLEATTHKTAGERRLETDPNSKDSVTWKKTPWKQTDAHPIVNISWTDASAFCKWLSWNEQFAYRLPTDAEWEYACRAGTTGLWSDNNDVSDLVKIGNVADATARTKINDPKLSYVDASDGAVDPVAVGGYRANAFGLHDMVGNVWEWTNDFYDGGDHYRNHATTPAIDPLGPAKADWRVRRGGSWIHGVGYSRSAARVSDDPNTFTFNYGFRIARTIEFNPPKSLNAKVGD